MKMHFFFHVSLEHYVLKRDHASWLQEVRIQFLFETLIYLFIILEVNHQVIACCVLNSEYIYNFIC